jgi:hypothetical protein
MDDYVRESFAELMQRGIEIDVWPSNDIRVLWLAQSRDFFNVGLEKQSVATQQIWLDHIRVIQPGEGDTLMKIVTDDLSLQFNVDTMASRDILIRNLIILVDHYKQHTAPEEAEQDKTVAQGLGAALNEIKTDQMQGTMQVIGLGMLLVSHFVFGNFSTAVGAALVVLAVILFITPTIVTRMTAASGKTSPLPPMTKVYTSTKAKTNRAYAQLPATASAP